MAKAAAKAAAKVAAVKAYNEEVVRPMRQKAFHFRPGMDPYLDEVPAVDDADVAEDGEEDGEESEEQSDILVVDEPFDDHTRFDGGAGGAGAGVVA